MKRRLAIQWRLALTSLALVVVVLVATGAAVVLLQREAINDALATRVRDDAQSLLAVAVHEEGDEPSPETEPTMPEEQLPLPEVETDEDEDESEEYREDEEDEEDDEDDEAEDRAAGNQPDGRPAQQDGTIRVALTRTAALDEGLDSSTRPYLVRRSGSDTLLAVRAPNGETLINEEDARALVPLLLGPTRDERITIGDETYQVAIARDASGTVAAAALSREEADEDIAGLIRAFLIAGAIGGLVTILLAWIATRRALRPLAGIADRAETITAGALDVRVGPVPGTDEISRLAASIDLMLGRLEDSFARQQRFVQDASHELRTPITIARGHLDVVDPDRDTSAEVRAAIDLAVSELERMARLVERLLVLARSGDGAPGDNGLLDVATIAEEALSRVGGDSERIWTLDPIPQPIHVRGDAEALVDVLVNLLENARRHTRVGGSVRVGVRAAGGRAVITVADDGEGIDPELLPHIFERFSRADRARGRTTGGTGLGLSICKAYVEAHGGTISIASELEVGTTVTIDLPRVS